MMQTNFFQDHLHGGRLARVLLRDGRTRYLSSPVVFGAGAGVVLLLSMVDMLMTGGQGGDSYDGLFGIVFILGGVFLTSQIFKDLYRPESRHTALMLPASALEKVLARFLAASAGWIVFSFLGFTLLSLAAEGINFLVFQGTHSLFHPFAPENWRMVPHYLVWQALFAAGSVFFRSMAFLKTLLVLSLAGFVLSMYSFILGGFLLGDFIQGQMSGVPAVVLEQAFEEVNRQLSAFSQVMKGVFRGLYWGVMPLFWWLFTWVRFREVQISDGV